MADSPGGVEEGRVSIRVVPDTSKFATDLRADLAKIAAEINFAIKVDLDNSGLDEKAKLAAKEAQAAAGNINIKTNVDNSQIAELKKGLTGIEGQTEGIGTSIGFWQGLILAAVAAVAIFGPALAVLLPLTAGIVLGFGAIALAMGGLKTVFQPLIDGFKKLQKPITAIVTSGLAPLVKTFTQNVIPVLKTGFSAVATIINGVLTAFLTLGQNTKFLTGLQTLLTGAATAFAPLVQTVPIVANAFLQIANAALPALLTLTTSFAGALTDFATGISNLAASGQLTTIISNAATAFSSFLDVVVAAVGALLKVGTVLAPAFTAVFTAIKPLIQAVGTELVGAFETLAPVVSAVFGFFNQNKVLFAALAGVILAIVSPVTLLAAALVILLANFKTIQPIIQTVFTAIVNATIPLQQAFTSVVTAAQGLFTVLAPIVTQIVALFIQNWPQIRTTVVQVFSTIQTVIVNTLTVISTQMQIATALIGFIWQHFGSIILSTIQNVFPAILTIISGVLNIIQGLVQLFTDLLKGNWSGAWADIKQIVSGAIQVLQGTVREGLGLLKGLAQVAITAFVDAFKSLGSKIVDAVGDLSGVLVQAGEDVISGLIKGIENATVGPLKTALGGVTDFIKKHKGPPSVDKVLLVPAGQQIIGGLIAGMESQLPAVKKSLSLVTAAVSAPNGVGGSSGGGPSVVYEHVEVTDLQELMRLQSQNSRDAATVANLQALLVG